MATPFSSHFGVTVRADGARAPMWKVGDQVQKATSYKWPGVVVSVFTTLSGNTRVVVECTDAEVAGALHIYSPEQLVAAERENLNEISHRAK